VSQGWQSDGLRSHTVPGDTDGVDDQSTHLEGNDLED
jgi:hypothetical protein